MRSSSLLSCFESFYSADRWGFHISHIFHVLFEPTSVSQFCHTKKCLIVDLKSIFPLLFRPCQCSPEGSDPSNTQCNEKGECSCKRNVIGAKCSQCNTGFYGLESSNPHGCKQCFCYGHTGICKVANGYTGRNISNQFTSGLEGWMVVNEQGTFCSLFC